MTAAKTFTQLLADGPVLFDGAMGTQLYVKGVFINRCFEEVNLSNADLVEQIHGEFIAAGAQVIETNTFGANRMRLAAHGLDNKIDQINAAGVEIARKAAGDTALVAGAIGPLPHKTPPHGDLPEKEAIDILAQHIDLVVKAGVDLLLLETVPTIEQLSLMARVARDRVGVDVPIIGQLTFDMANKSTLDSQLDTLVSMADEYDLNAVGANCSHGPDVYLPLVEQLAERTDRPIAVMPNAGEPRMIDGRQIYLATPDFFGVYTKRFLRAGARIVGGCCGTTPAHIESAAEQIGRFQSDQAAKPTSTITVKDNVKESVEPVPFAERSTLASKIGTPFVVSIELDPPKGAEPFKVLDQVRECRDAGIDAINIGDGPRATARMSPIPMAALIQREVGGIETIVHFCCRDRNVLGMQADMLGADALGLHNMVIITGDPPKVGNYPFMTGVFELDSIAAVKMAQNLNRGLDFAGNTIKGKTQLVTAVGAEPGNPNQEREIDRYRQKVEAGAEFLMTQPVYHSKQLRQFLDRTAEWRVPILLGILPLASLKNAEFLQNEVPGIEIPDDIMKRMRAAPSGDAARSEGIKIAQEALMEAREWIDGTYIMPPFNRHDVALEIVEVLK